MQAQRTNSPKSETGLQLNRMLFEGKGDEFALALASYVRTSRLVVGEPALNALIAAVRSVRA